MRILSFVVALLLSFSAAFGQKPFTLENELAKQLKKYPTITPYNADSCKTISLLGIEYARIDSISLKLDIFLPADTVGRFFNAIMFVHGGGWQSGDKVMDHQMARALADRGYACVCVDYRKSGVALYPAAVVDVRRAIRWLKANGSDYHIKPEGITLAGTSAGGQVAALLGSINGPFAPFGDDSAEAEQSSAVANAIVIDGVLAFIHPDSGEGADKPGKPSAATLWFGGNATEKRHLWQEASALNHVGQGSANFLFINSSQKRFSAGQAEMADSLRSLGHAADVRRTVGTPHTFWLFNPWAASVVDWIDEWLRPRLD